MEIKGTAAFIISRASQLIRTYFRPLQIDVTNLRAGHIRVQMTQFDASYPLVEKRIGGWIERALELSGARGLQMRIVKSFAAGDDLTEYDITWS